MAISEPPMQVARRLRACWLSGTGDLRIDQSFVKVVFAVVSAQELVFGPALAIIGFAIAKAGSVVIDQVEEHAGGLLDEVGGRCIFPPAAGLSFSPSRFGAGAHSVLAFAREGVPLVTTEGAEH